MSCRDAVTHAHSAVVADGVPHRHTIEAVATVHRWHHTGTPLKDSTEAVEALVPLSTRH